MRHDTKLRSGVKALCWRIIATIVIAFFVGIYTHKWDLAATVGGWTFVVNIILYYFHERVWEQITWGRIVTKKKR